MFDEPFEYITNLENEVVALREKLKYLVGMERRQTSWWDVAREASLIPTHIDSERYATIVLGDKPKVVWETSADNHGDLVTWIRKE